MSQDVHGRWKIDEDFAYVEFVPISEEDPTICRIVGTGFSNYAFPWFAMIREISQKLNDYRMAQ